MKIFRIFKIAVTLIAAAVLGCKSRESNENIFPDAIRSQLSDSLSKAGFHLKCETLFNEGKFGFIIQGVNSPDELEAITREISQFIDNYRLKDVRILILSNYVKGPDGKLLKTESYSQVVSDQLISCGTYPGAK